LSRKKLPFGGASLKNITLKNGKSIPIEIPLSAEKISVEKKKEKNNKTLFLKKGNKNL